MSIYLEKKKADTKANRKIIADFVRDNPRIPHIDIAKHFGCSPDTIRAAVLEFPYARRPVGRRANPERKLKRLLKKVSELQREIDNEER